MLIVAGEGSGDRIAALAAVALAARGARCFGVGGPACRAAGMEILVDAARVSAMGIRDVAAALPELASAARRVLVRLRADPPRAALLVDFTEGNLRLGRFLRARGTYVLWCVAPQVWAWRPRRLYTMRGAFDRLAVILPFEEALWRSAGHDAHYVGHPAMDARSWLGIPHGARAAAVLPGSRTGEVRRLAPALCEAAARLLDQGAVDDARVILAPVLDSRARSLCAAHARAFGLAVVEADAAHGAGPLLDAMDVALCASGTASLEAALAGAAPVVCYRLDAVAYAVARRLVRTPHIALPNVLLGRRAFPELLQAEVTATRISAAARELLARREDVLRAAHELRALLAPPSATPFGERVADLVRTSHR